MPPYVALPPLLELYAVKNKWSAEVQGTALALKTLWCFSFIRTKSLRWIKVHHLTNVSFGDCLKKINLSHFIWLVRIFWVWSWMRKQLWALESTSGAVQLSKDDVYWKLMSYIMLCCVAFSLLLEILVSGSLYSGFGIGLLFGFRLLKVVDVMLWF